MLKTCERLRDKGSRRQKGKGLGRVFPVLNPTYGLLNLSCSILHIFPRGVREMGS